MVLSPPAHGAAPEEAGIAPPPDKSSSSRFHPTPTAYLRELSTDRPDKTEVPFTVDAGHFQLEMDLFSYAYDRHNPERVDSRVAAWAIGPANLKLGLLNNVDAQLVLGLYRSVRTEDRSVSPPQITKQSGYGDTALRLKINLWGNDGGPTALGGAALAQAADQPGGSREQLDRPL